MAELPRYGRALLKISGEALAGNHDFGFDPDLISKIAGEIAEAQKTGTELGIVIGGATSFAEQPLPHWVFSR